MNPIGGYFPLELPNYGEYRRAIRLNTGRNALEYILKAKDHQKIYLPYYTCDVLLEPVEKLNIQHEFYPIDKAFYPVFDFKQIQENEVFLYTNYFGICHKQIKKIAQECNQLIIDNAQAFYARPLHGIDTFYSPRKFFGLPDGAYLYTNKILAENFPQDESISRMSHLLGRIDKSAEEFYNEFQKNDQALENQEIQSMSQLTQRLLSAIDYQKIKEKRLNNFQFLHEQLAKSNQLSFQLDNESVPMVYPYLVENGKEIKQKLIKNKVFVATYWPNVLNWTKIGSWEYYLTENLILLPIDQRYNETDLRTILPLL